MKIRNGNCSLKWVFTFTLATVLGLFNMNYATAQTTPPVKESKTEIVQHSNSTLPAKAAPEQSVNNAPPKIIGIPASMPKPIPLGISLMINKIISIEDKEETFKADFFVYYSWKDTSLAFDPKKIGSVRKEYSNEVATRKIHQIWSPHINITNLIDKPQEVSRGLKIYSDGSVIYSQHIVATFAAKFNFNSFPFDTQVLPLTFKSTRYDTQQLSFYQSQQDIDRSGVDENLKIKNWHVTKSDFMLSEERSWDGNLLPVFEAKTFVSRNASSEYFALLPLVLIMFMPLMNTLFLKADVGPRLTAWAGALLATIMLNTGFDSKYLFLDSGSLAKELITLSLAFQFIMMILTMTVFNPAVMDKLNRPHIVEEVNRFLKWAIPFSFILLIVSLILLNAFR